MHASTIFLNTRLRDIVRRFKEAEKSLAITRDNLRLFAQGGLLVAWDRSLALRWVSALGLCDKEGRLDGVEAGMFIGGCDTLEKLVLFEAEKGVEDVFFLLEDRKLFESVIRPRLSALQGLCRVFADTTD